MSNSRTTTKTILKRSAIDMVREERKGNHIKFSLKSKNKELNNIKKQ